MANRDKLRNKQAETSRDELKALTKQRKEERIWFPALHMWVSYLLSMFEKDRGTIPSNIGNRMLILNNMYCTKSYMTSMLLITYLSLDTPATFLEEINKALRDAKSRALVDMTVKNQKFDVNLEDSGLTSRISMWKSAKDSPILSKESKQISGQCLYTVDLVRAGQKLKKSRIFLKIRAKTGSELKNAEKIITSFLTHKQCGYVPISGNIKEMLKYSSMIADYKDSALKDVKTVVNTNFTLGQLMPNNNSINQCTEDSMYMGNNIQNNQEFELDTKAITKGRGIYVTAPAGVGKTVIALNFAQSFVENGNAVCLTDIKGNEFTTFINSTGGYIVSLTNDSTEYYNSWKMHRQDVDQVSASSYFYDRFNFSKKQMVILTGLVKQEDINLANQLFDEFLRSMYIRLGVLADNRNSWRYTEDLTPYKVYDMFVEYMTPTVIRRFATIASVVMQALKMTMSTTGSMSYIFRNEFDYTAILRSKTLSFSFNMLENSTFTSEDGEYSSIDKTVFKLKFEYMLKLKGRFVASKYAAGLETLVIDEESQMAPDFVLKSYVEDFTLRRAQRQTTMLLGNSVAALVNNRVSEALIENTTGLLIGQLESQDAIDLVVRKFGLEDRRSTIESISRGREFTNSFLFINKMEQDSLEPVLKLNLRKGKKYKMYTPVKH